jgi:hypothetical protein
VGRELAAKYRESAPPGQAYIDLLRLLNILGKQVAPAAAQEPPAWSDLVSVLRIQAALEP